MRFASSVDAAGRGHAGRAAIRATVVLGAAAALALVSGCGQKGPLSLPKPASPAAAPAAASGATR